MKKFLEVLSGIAGAIIPVVLGGIFIVFALAQCTSDAKWALALIGIGDDEETTEELLIRRPDLEDAEERDLYFALGLVAETAGLDLDRIKFAIAESDEFNAFTFNEEYFVFFLGVKRAPPNVVIAVAAHEVAHARLGHSAEISEKSRWADIATSIAATFAAASPEARDQVASWTSSFVVPRYSQRFELEADDEAVRILEGMGFENGSQMMMDGLEWALKNSSNNNIGGGYFSSHPSFEERMNALRR